MVDFKFNSGQQWTDDLEIFVILIQTLTGEVGDSIQKYPRPGGRTPGKVWEAESNTKPGGLGGGAS